jgi:hypothetical protein
VLAQAGVAVKMQQESDPPFALTYRDGSDYYFIPVAPVPAKKWRGPFASELTLSHALRKELKDDSIVTRTTVRPDFLRD